MCQPKSCGHSLNQKMDDHMQSISLHSLIAAQLSPNRVKCPSNSSPKRGVFAKKPQTAPASKVPNSVFALGSAWANSPEDVD